MTQDAASWLAGKEKLCRTGNVLVYIFVSFAWRSSQTPFETVRLSQVDFNDKAREKGPVRLSPRLFNVYDLQHIIAPTHTPLPTPPFYQSRKERLTHLCIASSVTTIGIWVSRSAEGGKMSVCRNNFFCFLDIFFFFISQKKQTRKKAQIKCCGNVSKPSWSQVL